MENNKMPECKNCGDWFYTTSDKEGLICSDCDQYHADW
jgi:hypothetical protein